VAGPSPAVWVSCSEAGAPLDERNVTRSWDRVRRRAQSLGVRPLRLRAARHTFATLALEAGRSIRCVAEQLAHANPELTLRVYAHALPVEAGDLAFADFAARISVSERLYPAPTPVSVFSALRPSRTFATTPILHALHLEEDRAPRGAHARPG